MQVNITKDSEVAGAPDPEPYERKAAALARWTGWHELDRSTHQRIAGAVLGPCGLAAAGEMWGWWPVYGAVIIGGAAAARWRLLPWWRTGDTRQERRMVNVINRWFDDAMITPRPEIRRDNLGTRRITQHPNSTVIELSVGSGARGRADEGHIVAATAGALAKCWDEIKAQVGEQCVHVDMHPGSGPNVRMVLIWRRDDADTWPVRIAGDTTITVSANPIRDGVWNESLQGFVPYQHATATEITAHEAALWRNVNGKWIKTSAIQEPEPEPAPIDNRRYAWGDDGAPALVEVDDTGELDGPEELDIEEPLPIWHTESSNGVEIEAPILFGGVVAGEGLATPPTPTKLDAPGGAPAILDHEDSRPLNARQGTRTGELWDALQTPGAHLTADLAEAAGMATESARQALKGWAALRLIDSIGEARETRWATRIQVVDMLSRDDKAG